MSIVMESCGRNACGTREKAGEKTTKAPRHEEVAGTPLKAFPETGNAAYPCRDMGLTYGYFWQVLSYPVKSGSRRGIRFHTFAQTIDRLAEAGQITPQSLAEIG
jgi:hypothetical protein